MSPTVNGELERGRVAEAERRSDRQVRRELAPTPGRSRSRRSVVEPIITHSSATVPGRSVERRQRRPAAGAGSSALAAAQRSGEIRAKRPK